MALSSRLNYITFCLTLQYLMNITDYHTLTIKIISYFFSLYIHIKMVQALTLSL